MKWQVLSAALIILAGLSSVSASAPGGHQITVPTDIVPAMASAQQPSDRLPPSAAKTFGAVGVDLGSSRFLGSGSAFEYFALVKGSDLICVAAVDSGGRGQQMGCASMNTFGSYGLRSGARVGNSDRTEEAWLVVPNTTPLSLSNDASGNWVRKASNFFVKESN
ncbi:hypothetical protein [Sinomonas gamaensis]|uniref:hypothetical protein n=1 Tax=Sinomonas gamaensis TaxID=2565624 RepID=UPI001108DFF2|nr:hypothetical protein [Sinomonas gamaensis]